MTININVTLGVTLQHPLSTLSLNYAVSRPNNSLHRRITVSFALI